MLEHNHVKKKQVCFFAKTYGDLAKFIIIK